MTLKIRPGDLEADRDAAIRLLASYVNPAYDGRRFDWAYHRAPAGSGRLWMAVDGSTGDVVGMAGAFPRMMLVDGRPGRAWLLGDFCMAHAHRALGPALQLQRACLNDLAEDGMGLCYDFPSRSMQAIYRRLGIVETQRLVRFVRPLRVADRLELRGGAWLGRSLGRLLDIGLGWAARSGRSARGITVAVHTGRCGQEFSTLTQLAGPAYGLCGERSAQYVNWRYLDNPIQRHDILTARLGTTLVGWAAVTSDGESATLADLFAIPDQRVLAALIRGATARLWAQGAARLSFEIIGSHPWASRLGRFGFRPRDDAPVAVFAPSGSDLSSDIPQHTAWFLTHGDRDG